MLVIPVGDLFFFFFNDTATTEIYTLSLHDALPIWISCEHVNTRRPAQEARRIGSDVPCARLFYSPLMSALRRSEEHTSELQSRQYLVCRLLLEKKKNIKCRVARLLCAQSASHTPYT